MANQAQTENHNDGQNNYNNGNGNGNNDEEVRTISKYYLHPRGLSRINFQRFRIRIRVVYSI